MISKLHSVLTSAVLSLTLAAPVVMAQNYPERPITLIVPFAAGGGSDTVARTLQRVVDEQKLLDVPIVVVNMPGAGGSVGGRAVVEAEPDGYPFGLWHYGLLTSKALGVSDFGPDDVSTVAMFGRWNSILIAPTKTGYTSLDDFIADAKARPGKVVEATAIGSEVHLQHELLAAKSDGLNVKLLQSGGGAKRLAALLGGHADVTVYSMGEYLSSANPDIRALVQFSTERNPLMPDVPTAIESGVDQVWNNYNWVMAPKGTPPEHIDTLPTAIKAAMDTQVFKDMMTQRALVPEFISSAEAPAVYGPAQAEIAAGAAALRAKSQ